MHIGALGWLRVRGADGSEVELGGTLERRVLTALVVRAGHVVSRDMLAEAVFGEAVPDNADMRLQNHVSRLRKRVGGQAIATVAPGYRLEVRADALDWCHFEQLVIAATDLAPNEPARAAETFEAALELWRGHPFGDLDEWEPAQALAVRLEELRRVAEEERAGALVATGRAATIVGTLEALVADEPLRERRWMLLMTALQRTGRQAEALRTFQRARQVLNELGLQPGPDLVSLERAIAVNDDSLRIDAAERPISPPRHNLPTALTRFVGRSAELAEIFELLGGHRLVTLTGVGGVGKTRLAVETAGRALLRYPDGVWLVELAPLTDGPAVAFALAAALGIGERAEDESIESALCGRLSGWRTLLVVDNCEHLVEPAAALVDLLLTTCPTVNVLATSRERLDLPAEVVWDMPPMSLPASGGVSDVRASDAGALFVERAQAARREFQLTEGNAADIANICTRLDGIALALELAASRVHSLGVADLGRHLDHSLGGPGPRSATPRQRTLRATLDWSYELLSSAERAALRRFAVFQSTFDLDAAVAVLDDGHGHGVEIVGGLVDKSLVVHARAGPYPRYRLLEPVRQYAAGRLAEAGETEVAERRHVDVFLARARATQDACLGGLTHGDYADAPDFRVAMERSWRDHHVDAALSLLLAHFLEYIFVNDHRGGATLERLLAEPRQVDLRNRALGLVGLALNARNASPPDHDRADDLASEAVAAARASGDLNTLATCEFSYADLKMSVGDVTAAGALLRSVRAACAQLGSDAGVGWCEHHLGWIAIGTAGPRAAAAHFGEAVELGRNDTAGAPMLVVNALASLAPVTALLGHGALGVHQSNEAMASARALGVPGSILVALLRGAETNVITDRFDDARDLVRELLREMRDHGTVRWAGDALETAAIVLERTLDTASAAEALGAATALRDAAGEPRGGVRVIAPEVGRSRLRLLTELGPERFARLDTRGRSRSVPDALDAACAALGD